MEEVKNIVFSIFSVIECGFYSYYALFLVVCRFLDKLTLQFRLACAYIGKN